VLKCEKSRKKTERCADSRDFPSMARTNYWLSEGKGKKHFPEWEDRGGAQRNFRSQCLCRGFIKRMTPPNDRERQIPAFRVKVGN